MIVVDASVLACAIADGGADGEASRRRLEADSDIHVPHLVDLEVASVLRRRRRAHQIDDRRTELAMRDLHDLPAVRYPHLPFLGRIWELRTNLTPYDAAYVALAESLRCALVTADERIRRASGVRCRVEVLRPKG
jgi:predicted nucleic acid-binding protein